MSNKKVPKITTPTSREQAIALAKDLYGLYIEGVFFGTLDDEFAPEFQVNWSESMMGDFIGSMASNGKAEGTDSGAPRMQKVADAFAIGGVRGGKGFGLSAKKVFDNATPFNWNANVTLVDWDGTGDVWKKYELLKAIALPKTLTSNGTASAMMASLLASFSGGGTLKSGLENAGKALLASTALSIAGEGGLIDEDAMEGAKARSVVTAPDPVHIRIGRYGRTQGSSPIASMKVFIQSVGATFSKEMTAAGPMYATFSITFESVEPMTYESMPVGGGRVEIIGGE